MPIVTSDALTTGVGIFANGALANDEVTTAANVDLGRAPL
jgi:hypothetical protein